MPGEQRRDPGADYLLKIDNIEGESMQAHHEKWIEALSWSWDGAANGGSSALGSGAGSGKVAMRDFRFSVHYGISSPKLFCACCTGDHTANVLFHIRKAGGGQFVYVEWKFTDIVISSYRTVTVDEAGEPLHLPTDEISFNFARLEMEYKPQKSNGELGPGVKAGFDLKIGTKV